MLVNTTPGNCRLRDSSGMPDFCTKPVALNRPHSCCRCVLCACISHVLPASASVEPLYYGVRRWRLSLTSRPYENICPLAPCRCFTMGCCVGKSAEVTPGGEEVSR